MTTNKTLPVDPAKPDPDTIIKAGKVITQNGVVIFPATCLYGVAANALNEIAVKKVFLLKHRPLNNPILMLIPDRAMLPDLVTSIPETAQKLMTAFWPGHLTLIFRANDHISPLLTANTGKIGIRIPVHPVAKALVDKLGHPVTGTSANLSGQKNCSRIDRLDPFIEDNADLILDAGILKGGTGSTIADVTGSKIKILRQGEITSEQIFSVL